MAGLNDVVRHVILRVIVDSEGLSEQLAGVRSKLAALKNAEGQSNADRVKSQDTVTKAIEAQNKALDTNAKAHEAARRARSGEAAQALSGVTEHTEAIKENTATTRTQIREEAQAEEIRKRAHQDELDRIAQREAAQRLFLQSLVQMAQAQKDADRLRDQAASDAERRAERAYVKDQERADRRENRAREAFQREQDREAERERREAERERNRDEREARRFTEEQRREDFRARQQAFNEQRRENRSYATFDDALDDSDARRRATFADRLAQDFDSVRNARARDASETARSASQAATAASAARDAADRARMDAQQRIIRNKQAELRLDEQIRDAARRGAISEQRILEIEERRVRAAIRFNQQQEDRLNRQRRSNSLLGAFGSALADATVLTGRVLDPQSGARRAFRDTRRADPRSLDEQERRATTVMGRLDQRIEDLARRIDSLPWFRRLAERANAALTGIERAGDRVFTRLGSSGEASVRRIDVSFARLRRNMRDNDAGAVSAGFVSGFNVLNRAVNDSHARFRRFFSSIPRSAASAGESLTTLTAKVRGFFDELNKPRSGLNDRSLLRTFAESFDDLGNRMASTLQRFGRHLFSLRTLVVLVIAAFGPLAAVLGAVGAAAMAVGANIVALAGSLLALPGIIGAVVAGFSALAIAVKPLSDVFSAYSAKQKAAAENTKAAAEAALELKDAILSEQLAHLAYNRAVADEPRARQRLSDAIKQATRDIEDLRLARQKLRHEEEGAALGVESAEQAYRRALADPTASSLDRRIAQHSLEGAKFDQRDQQVTGRRLIEDSEEAYRKGVQGADAVIEAQRGVTDATNEVSRSFLAWQKAIQAVEKARAKDAAGGTDAAQKYQEELAKLSPAARKVFEGIVDLDDAWKAFQKRISEAVFGPISDDTGKFADVLKNLERFLLPVAEAIGYLAEQALDLFTNPAWTQFFTEQGQENATLFTLLATAALRFADGMRGIVEAARPFTEWVVGGINKLAASFQDFATSEDGREKVASFLEVVKRTMQELWPVVTNLAGGLAGFFKALTQEGENGEDSFLTWFNTGLADAMRTFNELGQKAQDPQGGFQKWLRDVKPLLSDIVGFLAAAGRFFGDLFSNTDNINEARAILKEIADRWLPALADIFDKLSESGLMSNLAETVGKVIEGLRSFFESGVITGFLAGISGTFSTVAGWFEKIAGWVEWLITNVPGMQGVFTGLAFVIGTLFATALIAKLTGVVRALSGIFGLATGISQIASAIRPGGFSGGAAGPGGVGGPGGPGGPGGAGGEQPQRQSRWRRIFGGGQPTTSGTPGTPGAPAGVTPPGTRTSASVTGHLTAIEKLLIEIRNTLRICCGSGGIGDRDKDTRSRTRSTRATRTTAVATAAAAAAGPAAIDADRRNWRESTRPRPSTDIDYPRQNFRYLPGTGGYVDLPEVESRRARTLPPGIVQPQLPATASQRALPAAPPPRRPSQFPGGPRRPPAAPQLPDVGADYRPYTQPGLYDDYTVPPRQQRDARGRFVKATPSPLPDRPITALPWVGDDRSVYVDPNARTARPSQYPAGVRRPPARPSLADTGTSNRPYIGLDDAYDVPRNVRPMGTYAPPQLAVPVRGTLSDEPERPSPRRTRTTAAPEQRALPPGRRPAVVGEIIDAAPRTGDTGRRARTTPIIEGEVVQPRRRSRLAAGLRNLGRRFMEIHRDDSGAAQIAPERDRRDRTTRVRSRVGTRPAGRLGGLLGGLGGLFGGGVATGALTDVLDGDVLDEDQYRDVRRRRAAEDAEADSPRRGRTTDVGYADAPDRRLARRGTRAPGRLSSLGRGLRGAGGALARGAVGGIGGAIASTAAYLGGDYLINSFVKDDEDAGSLSRGLGAVANGAGLGAMIGSVVPGVGTVIGGAVGGLAGGAYSLLKDKNLRSFVGDKIGGAAKSVGGFVSGAARGVGGFVSGMFGGGDDDKPGGGIGGALKGGLAAMFPVGGLAAMFLGKNDIGKAILDSLKKAGRGIGDFFTKTIPGFFTRGIKGIEDFFTKTLPSLPNRAIKGLAFLAGYLLSFFTVRLPRMAGQAWDAITSFFTETLPRVAGEAWAGITGFFTETLPQAASAAWENITSFFTVTLPEAAASAWAGITSFFTETLPEAASAVWTSITTFFTETLPEAAQTAWDGITGFFTETLPSVFSTVVDSISTFFGTTLPNFFTDTLPNAIKKLPGFLYDSLIQPVLDFFGGLADHVGDFLKGSWDWAKGLFSGAGEAFEAGKEAGAMSGGLVDGIYQGIEDNQKYKLTVGEFVVRRGVTQEPGAKAFLRDFNEHGMDALYRGLSVTTAPQVMSMVPPDAQNMTGAVPTVVNNTINHAPLMGDVTINNPVRERSDTSLRRQVQIAAIRHRR